MEKHLLKRRNKENNNNNNNNNSYNYIQRQHTFCVYLIDPTNTNENDREVEFFLRC